MAPSEPIPIPCHNGSEERPTPLRWYPREDEVLMEGVKEFGTDAWGKVAGRLWTHKTPEQCAARWRELTQVLPDPSLQVDSLSLWVAERQRLTRSAASPLPRGNSPDSIPPISPLPSPVSPVPVPVRHTTLPPPVQPPQDPVVYYRPATTAADLLRQIQNGERGKRLLQTPKTKPTRRVTTTATTSNVKRKWITWGTNKTPSESPPLLNPENSPMPEMPPSPPTQALTKALAKVVTVRDVLNGTSTSEQAGSSRGDTSGSQKRRKKDDDGDKDKKKQGGGRFSSPYTFMPDFYGEPSACIVE